MSSALQSAVSIILDNNYGSLIILTAIGYDYILTLSDEIEYVWNRPWTRVSTLFILVRYFGLCGVVTYLLCKILSILGQCAMSIFIASTDLMMMLRVWSIYDQSKILLGTLLMLYIAEVVPLTVGFITYCIKATLVVVQIPGFSFCVMNADAGPPILFEVIDIVQLVFSAVLFLLVIWKFALDAFGTYKATKGWWQPNRYLNLFAKEGVLYFLAFLLFGLIDFLALVTKIIPATGWVSLMAVILTYVPLFTLSPRLIMSVRALYERDIRGNPGLARSIDIEFGLSSVQACSFVQPVIAFADQGREDADSDEDGTDASTTEEIPRGGRFSVISV